MGWVVLRDLNVIRILSDSDIRDSILAQVTRDLMVLSLEFYISINDPDSLVPKTLLTELGIDVVDQEPDLWLVYKLGDVWPEPPQTEDSAKQVKRDLKPTSIDLKLDGNGQVGYYLKPQGRDGPNRTEMFLNRAHPMGRGNMNPLITLFWG